ncbi:MAG: hypothetical protein IJ780_03835 [Neisseriaceae bacterium]|nr:hypothetical protein [Neisseriaceae bacterium]
MQRLTALWWVRKPTLRLPNNLIMKSIDKVLTVISILLVSVLIIGVITFMLPDGFWNKIANTLGYWSEYHQAINNIEIYE